MKISLLWDVMLGRLVAGGQCFYQTPQHHIHSASEMLQCFPFLFNKINTETDALLYMNYTIFSSH
jgi:hypothetical protein